MSEDVLRPAWSQSFNPDAIRQLLAAGPLGGMTPEWAWGGSTGKGIRVAVIDSGIEYDHPAVGDAVRGGVIVDYDKKAENFYRITPIDKPSDMSGHGTACAGIIHAIAPEAEIYSVRVLGRDMSGRAIQFAAGLDWSIENDIHVINMSLSTSLEDYFGLFHDLADQAYFKNMNLVSAVNNIPEPSFPSLFSSVISVAAHDGHGDPDPLKYFYNPNPPVEFGAPGINVDVAWLKRQTITATGNSFAAPHMAGIVALIRAKHPALTPFQMKTVLYSCASNVRRENS